MHEGAITKSIIDTSLSIIEKEGLISVDKINISVGKIHAIVPEVLLNLFNIMKLEHPPIAQSELEITGLDVKIHCKTCGQESILDEPLFICLECGSTQIDVIQGNELHIMSIEGEN